MSRSLYFVGAWAAMLFIVFAATVADPQPPAAHRTSVATAAADPVIVAIDDLAAWPISATR